MPKTLTKDTVPLMLELPRAVNAQLRAFAEGRGATIKSVVVHALTRHFAYPPAPIAAPIAEPFPPDPPKRGRGRPKKDSE